MEEARRERDGEAADPFHALFQTLRDRAAAGGMTALGDDEKVFFAVSALLSDLHRGAIQLYFDATAADAQLAVETGLRKLSVLEPIAILREAKPLCEQDRAWLEAQDDHDSEPPNEERLAELTADLLEHADELHGRLRRFAVSSALVGGS